MFELKKDETDHAVPPGNQYNCMYIYTHIHSHTYTCKAFLSSEMAILLTLLMTDALFESYVLYLTLGLNLNPVLIYVPVPDHVQSRQHQIPECESRNHVQSSSPIFWSPKVKLSIKMDNL